MHTATTRAAGCRIAIVAGIATIAFALGGCVHSRVLKQPVVEEPSRLGWSAGAPDGASLTLRQLIVTNNSGSWVEDALWDEYVLEISNGANAAIELRSLRLESAHLPPQAPLTSRVLLESATAKNMDALKGAGIVVGIGVVAPMALIATAGGGPGMSAGVVAATTYANFMAMGLLVGGSYMIAKSRIERYDRTYMDAELERRTIVLPTAVPTGSTVFGSAFFPVTPRPTALVLELHDGSVSRQLAIDLTPLETLDLVPLEEPIKAPKPKSPPKNAYAEGEVPPKHNPWACGRCSSRNED
jgi:hypothetical protein